MSSMQLLRKVSFFVLAGGIEQVRLDGEGIVGQFGEPDKLKALRDSGKRPPLVGFVNWGRKPEDIVRFTQRYGPLRNLPPDEDEFRFPLAQWRDAQDWFRERWVGRQRTGWQQTFLGALAGHPAYSWCYRDGRLEYQAGSLEEFLWLSFYAIPAERLRKCPAPGCQTPFFIAEHLNVKCCSDRCKHERQKESKREAWRRNGHRWRHRR